MIDQDSNRSPQCAIVAAIVTVAIAAAVDAIMAAYATIAACTSVEERRLPHRVSAQAIRDSAPVMWHANHDGAGSILYNPGRCSI